MDINNYFELTTENKLTLTKINDNLVEVTVKKYNALTKSYDEVKTQFAIDGLKLQLDAITSLQLQMAEFYKDASLICKGE